MTSPPAYHLAALSLVAVTLFAAVAVYVLRRFCASIQRARDEFARDGDRMSHPAFPSKPALQAKDGVLGASSRVHTSDSDVSPSGSLRGTEAKGARTL